MMEEEEAEAWEAKAVVFEREDLSCVFGQCLLVFPDHAASALTLCVVTLAETRDQIMVPLVSYF